MSAAPFVTVLTPFHNTREFLAECIESVLRQTYENWDYILIDNWSTDGSEAIAADYASRFPGKIRCIRTPSFLSQVQNYNFGLSCISADGKYCKVVQADDWLFPDCIRSMVEVAEAHPAVGIVSAYELEGDRVSLSGLPYPSPEVPGREAGRLYFLNRKYLFGTPTSVLMRSETVRSRQPFYEERYAPFEDVHACFQVLKTWNFGFVHQVLTYSRRQNDSLLSRLGSFGFERFLRLSALVVHGRDYLSDAEYDRCLREAERQYFLNLGRSMCKLGCRNEKLWQFHRSGLASIDYPFSWSVLLKRIPRAFLEQGWAFFWKVWVKAFALSGKHEHNTG